MVPIKKLYMDSKARTADRKSTSEFAVGLVESLTMPEVAMFQVCDVFSMLFAPFLDICGFHLSCFLHPFIGHVF